MGRHDAKREPLRYIQLTSATGKPLGHIAVEDLVAEVMAKAAHSKAEIDAKIRETRDLWYEVHNTPNYASPDECVATQGMIVSSPVVHCEGCMCTFRPMSMAEIANNGQWPLGDRAGIFKFENVARYPFDEAACPGHTASVNDPKVCGKCGTHIDSLRDEDAD